MDYETFNVDASRYVLSDRPQQLELPDMPPRPRKKKTPTEWVYEPWEDSA